MILCMNSVPSVSPGIVTDILEVCEDEKRSGRVRCGWDNSPQIVIAVHHIVPVVFIRLVVFDICIPCEFNNGFMTCKRLRFTWNMYCTTSLTVY